MAFLGPESLKELLSNSPIILDDDNKNCYDENRIEQACYALSLGVEVYRTDNKDRKIENLTDTNRTVEINPGQFALLMTKEFVDVPQNMLAFISIKAKNKLKGLINVSGFHVDPGFKGRLLFSVYNAGPSTITLQTGDPYFLIWFTKLDKATALNDQYNKKENHHQGQSTIKLDYIDALKRGELASPHALLDKINKNENELQRVFWALGILIAISVAIFGKLWLDNNKFKEGYEKAIEDQVYLPLVEKKLDNFVKDSISLHKIDSLISSRLQKQKNVNQK
ncbi:dCTP deaminase domain-containing protein [Elizabethkingia anophelis]|uniref:dCTP deaminase domain-containing protein n=1 Tax=Elizabethkingia anophelis TaxID=1117645 RepID=UPI003733C68F